MRHFDFGRPVLDFTVGDDGVIVVSLDGQWDEPDVIGNRLMVRTVKECSGEVPIRWLIVHGDDGLIIYICSLSKRLIHTGYWLRH